MTHCQRSTTLSIVAAIAFALPLPECSAHAGTNRLAAGLWVGGWTALSEYQGRILQSGGGKKPNLIITGPEFSDAQSITFDQAQNLWFSYLSDLSPFPQIVELTRKDIVRLANDGEVRPKVVLANLGKTGQAMLGPDFITFDSAGNLWLAGNGANGIMEFLPAQIAVSGSPTPTISITSTNFYPGAVRFDGANNLWVEQFVSTPPSPPTSAQIWRFAPSDRAASGTANPSLMLDLPTSFFPSDIAFDSGGNLWATGWTTDTKQSFLVKYSAEDLTGSGEITPRPSVTISSVAFGEPSLDPCLAGLDFDAQGDLWASVQANQVDCFGNSQVIELTPDQLQSGGNVNPSVSIAEIRVQKHQILPGPVRFGPIAP
jgi:hypothetical protein